MCFDLIEFENKKLNEMFLKVQLISRKSFLMAQHLRQEGMINSHS
jgi:hypothetical protein